MKWEGPVPKINQEGLDKFKLQLKAGERLVTNTQPAEAGVALIALAINFKSLRIVPFTTDIFGNPMPDFVGIVGTDKLLE